MDTCLICTSINEIKKGTNSYFVKELKTGYVVLGWHQYFKGYTLFLYKHHKEELHELDPKEKQLFLSEMAKVAEAAYQVFSPQKLNYEMLGNSERHMHWHLFPRYSNDIEPKMPIWIIDKTVREAESTKPSMKELEEMKKKLLEQLDK